MERMKLEKLKIKILQEALGKPVMEYQKFHQTSSLKKIPEVFNINKNIQLKEYLRLEKLILTKAKKSVYTKKNYIKSAPKKQQTIDLNSISEILFLSGGLQKSQNKINANFHLYKGQYALEVYFYSMETELPVGFYHYNPRNHTLAILPFKHNSFIKKGLKIRSNTKLIFFITGVFERLTSLIQDRGYTLLLKEVGYLTQNILMFSKSYGWETEIVEDFVSQVIDADIELDSTRESVLEVLLVKERVE